MGVDDEEKVRPEKKPKKIEKMENLGGDEAYSNVVKKRRKIRKRGSGPS